MVISLVKMNLALSKSKARDIYSMRDFDIHVLHARGIEGTPIGWYFIRHAPINKPPFLHRFVTECPLFTTLHSLTSNVCIFY